MARQRRIAGLAGKDPNQFKLPGFLWTRHLVAELIEREYSDHRDDRDGGLHDERVSAGRSDFFGLMPSRRGDPTGADPVREILDHT